MSEHTTRTIDDYPDLTSCLSNLRACSKDDSDPTNITYMFEREDCRAIDFDRVMRNYCSNSSQSDGSGELGLARSADALYVGQDEHAWNDTISLIEFKNGNLFDRRHILSNSERNDFRHGLIEAIATVFEKDAKDIGWEALVTLEDSLTKTVDDYVNSHLGRAQARKRGARTTRQRDSFTLETVKSKAAYSALLLQNVLGVSSHFIREHVNFILVYNPAQNPGDDAGLPHISDNTVPHIPSIESEFPSRIARYAGRPLRRFGLRDSIGHFFRDVYTCTADELKVLLQDRG